MSQGSRLAKERDTKGVSPIPSKFREREQREEKGQKKGEEKNVKT